MDIRRFLLKPDHSQQISEVSNKVESVSCKTSIQANTDAEPTSQTQESHCWYKGCKVDLTWLKSAFPCLVLLKIGKRKGVKCTLCCDNIVEAKKASRRGVVPLADGARCDSKQAIERLIDHLKSEVHATAERAQRDKDAWKAQSESHPWVKVLKTHESNVIKIPIRLAVDIHNDSMTKTLSAWSWPSRYLAQQHADNQVAQYVDHGLDVTFAPFSTSPDELHYISPDVYSEMMKIISEMEIEKLKEKIRQVDCFSIQLDKSVDKYNVDSMFATIRYLDNDYSMGVGFLGECHSNMRGAQGMLSALTDRLESIGIVDLFKAKLVGLTTDGENANTGKKGGLWALITEYLNGRIPITIWCVAHRSDLAFESIESQVSEFRHWLADLRSLTTFYRSSPAREEEIRFHARSIDREQEVKRFPKHHEIRFAEHLLNLVDAAIANRDFMLMHWRSWRENGNKSEREKCDGFLKSWRSDSLNWRMTCLVGDLLNQFQKLQKEAQRSFVTMCDLLSKRDQVLKSLDLMLEDVYPGGREEKYQTKDPHQVSDETDPPCKRTKFNSFVSFSRSFESARKEVVLCARNFLEERLNEEQNEQVTAMVALANGQNAKEMIANCRDLVISIFGIDAVEKLADDCIEFFVQHGCRNWNPQDSVTAKLYDILKKSRKGRVS